MSRDPLLLIVPRCHLDDSHIVSDVHLSSLIVDEVELPPHTSRNHDVGCKLGLMTTPQGNVCWLPSYFTKTSTKYIYELCC